jgi:hypothetical protein
MPTAARAIRSIIEIRPIIGRIIGIREGAAT